MNCLLLLIILLCCNGNGNCGGGNSCVRNFNSRRGCDGIHGRENCTMNKECERNYGGENCDARKTASPPMTRTQFPYLEVEPRTCGCEENQKN